LDPNIHDTFKPRRGQASKVSANTVKRRMADIRDKYSLDMQKVRFELILELKALAELAQQRAIDTHPAETEAKQNWARLAAYISQVINGIGKTYDESKINAELEELEKQVNEVIRDKRERTQRE
jgi:hypothetical protein